jgi:hypothetical protein
MYNAAEIVRAINQAYTLLTKSQTVGRNKYPHEYNKDGNDLNAPRNIGQADRTRLMLYPLRGGPASGGYAYGTPPTLVNGDPGKPSTDRVIFDVCAQFASVMSHIGLDDNHLRMCYEVDERGNHIITPGVPGMHPNPPRPIGAIRNLPRPPPPQNPSPSQDGVGAVGGEVGFIPTAGSNGIGEGAQGGTVGEMPLDLIPGFPGYDPKGPGPQKKAEAAPAA